MNEDFIKNIMWQSTEDVFNTMLSVPIELVNEISQIESPSTVASTITFTGRLQGCFSLICPMQIAELLTRAMLLTPPDETVVEDEIFDAIGEITNMIIGGIKTALADTITEMNISVPTSVKGCQIKPYMGKNSSKIIVAAKIDSNLINLVFIHKNL